MKSKPLGNKIISSDEKPLDMKGFSLEKADREAIGGFFAKLRLNDNKKREIITCLKEISARDEVKISRLLKSMGIINILDDEKLTGPQKGDRIRNIIFKKRFPQIAGYREKYRKLRNRIIWPRGIQINAVDILEEGTHKLTFEFKTIAEFNSKLRELIEFGKNKDFLRLIEPSI
ncbi:MAG: hypothetical protein ABIA63_12890 [bacterium]